MRNSSGNWGIWVQVAGMLIAGSAFVACTDENTSDKCFDPLSAECNQGTSSSTSSGSSLTPQPDTFFEGTYKTGPIEYAWQFNQEVTNAAKLAVAYDWAGVEAAIAPSTLLGQKLEAMVVEFSVGAEAQARSPKALIAKGISLGKAAGADEIKKNVAKQYVEKSLLVLTQLFAMHEIEEALEATMPTDAAVEIDAAAIVLATLESRMISRQTTEVPDLWKMGSTLITTDKLAMHTGELLFTARTKMGEGAPDAGAALAKANVYATKYFYASVLNYGYKVQVAEAADMSSEVAFVEGGMFSEGLSTSFFGAEDANAKPMRDLWTGPSLAMNVAALRPVAIGVYGKVAANAASYYSIPEGPVQKEMIEMAGKIAGTVEVLTEALDAQGVDVPGLQAKASSLVDAAVANDVAGADTLAKEISATITAAAK
jgi:hypothetical protein